MAGAGKKTFTAGEVLTASDTNTYLMEQTVMYFAGTAARASAIPTPSTGMTSYIGVTGTATIPQIETYTGSAWQTPYGLTLVARADFSAAVSVTIDNVFSANYANYQIVLALTGANLNDQAFQIRFRTAGVEPANNYYSALTYRNWTAGATSVISNSNQAFGFMGGDTTNHGSSTATIINPFLAQRTSWHGVGTGGNGTSSGGGVLSDSTSFDGLRITSVATQITGTLRVYGFRNS